MLNSLNSVMKGKERRLAGSTQIQSITQAVSWFGNNSKLQTIKTLRFEADWFLALEFYPEPGFVYIGLRGQEPVFVAEKRKIGTPASHPAQLYLKAHYLNDRVTRAESPQVNALKLFFGEDGRSITFEAAAGGVLRLVCEVPDRKPYRQELKLALWPAESDDEAAVTETSPETASVVSPEERKREKLLANIRNDVREAEDWLHRFGGVCRRLSEDPSLWKRPEGWLPEERTLLEEEIRAGRLPPFADQRHATASAALDRLFRLRRRAERKLEGGQERLRRVQAKRIDHDRSSAGNLRSPQSGGPVAAGKMAAPIVPRKKPGLWVELRENLWARLGRSASENDELFRQARDRDLWFHVRGGAGAHVWIPRGQPGLGAKSDASEEVLRLGCQLALINSKAAKSGSAVVDFTERRGLRKIRGAAGGVEILRSQTRLVRLDEAFEKKIMRGGEG